MTSHLERWMSINYFTLINCCSNIFCLQNVSVLSHFNFEVMTLSRFKYGKTSVIYGFLKKII